MLRFSPCSTDLFTFGERFSFISHWRLEGQSIDKSSEAQSDIGFLFFCPCLSISIYLSARRFLSPFLLCESLPVPTFRRKGCPSFSPRLIRPCWEARVLCSSDGAVQLSIRTVEWYTCQCLFFVWSSFNSFFSFNKDASLLILILF